MTATSQRDRIFVEKLRQRLSELAVIPRRTQDADAAVLILVRIGPRGPEVLAEQRAERPGDPWSGQVGLPGGRVDPGDPSLTATVLRELFEEVGIPPSAIDGPPRLFDLRPARPSGLRVAAFAGQLVADSNASRGPDPAEVATTFWFPLEDLVRVEPRPRPGAPGGILVDSVAFDGHVVWGFTLRLLRDFATWLNLPAAGR